jgi:hypothetical protein
MRKETFIDARSSIQVLPITDSMRQPHRFPAVLTGVMIFLMRASASFLLSILPIETPCILVLFGGAGALSYLTFGKDVQSVVITNLDTNSRMVQAVCPIPLSHPSVSDLTFLLCVLGAANLFSCDPALRAAAAFPSCAYHGARTVCYVGFRQTRPPDQVVEEFVPVCRCHVLHSGQLGRNGRLGQVRGACGELRLVGD